MKNILASYFTKPYSKILYETYSEISGKLKVVEGVDGRELLADGVTHTIKKSNRVNYWRVSVEYSEVKNNDKILILGLGGGEIARILNEKFKGLQIDAVELDPVIIDIYLKFFKNKNENNVNIIQKDAYKFVTTNKSKYNIIYGDVYLKGLYSKDLLEDKFLRYIYKTLYKGGQYISNRIFSISPQYHGREYENQLKMYFNNVYCKYVGDENFKTANYVFFACK